MKFDFLKQFDINKARVYLEKLIKDQSKCDLTKPREARSLSQNSYIHVCFDLFGIEFGYTRDEAKTLLKRKCSFTRYTKLDEVFLSKTSLMSTKELTDFIDWIRNYSSLNGCYLPTPTEYLENKFNIDKDIDNYKEFL